MFLEGCAAEIGTHVGTGWSMSVCSVYLFNAQVSLYRHALAAFGVPGDMQQAECLVERIRARV